MARKIIVNNKGQALAEALMLSTFIFVGTFFLLAVFLNQITSIATDDALENYFFCHLQKKSTCRSDLNNSLNQLRLRNISITENIYPPNFEITLHANTSTKYEIYKKRKMQFEHKVRFF
jgi:hypothetical protein